MRLKLISCEMFHRELRAVAARSHNRVEIELLPSSLHQLTPQEMRRGLQNLVGRIQRNQFHAVLLVSGTCQQSLAGLQARSVPLVLPRAKDCLSLLMERPHEARHRVVLHGLSARRQTEFDTDPRLSHLDDPQESGSSHRFGRRGTGSLFLSRPHASASPSAWRFPARHEPLLDRRRLRSTRGKLLRKAGHGGRVISGRKVWPLRPAASLLQLLVDGYWSYDDFLVVPAGYQVAVQAGAILAEEIHV